MADSPLPSDLDERTPVPLERSELAAQLTGRLKFILRHHHGQDPSSAKERAIEVLDTIKDHLVSLGIERSLLTPLEDIRNALSEAQRGLDNALLKRADVSGRPPLSVSELSLRLGTSIVMDLLMAANQKEQVAAKHVAKRLEQWAIAIGGNTAHVGSKTLKGWRRDLAKAGKAQGHHEEVKIWYGQVYLFLRDEILTWIEKEGLDPEVVANERLERIQKDFGSGKR